MNRFFLILLLSASLGGESQVTYGLSGGRLGDDLVSYLHAKWISYKYGIPLAYRPFNLSDSLVLHEIERPLGNQKTDVLRDLGLLKKGNSLYEIPYAPECFQEYEMFPHLKKNSPYIKVNWGDKTFIEMVRPLVAPRIPVPLLPLPTDKVTVAVHLRRATGVDARPSTVRAYPYKFVSDAFYLDQIRWIWDEMGRKPLYIFFFSNDSDLAETVQSFQKKLNLPHVTFDYRRDPGHPDIDLLSDLFSMMQFDCLIRAESNLSIVASKLGFQKIIISPEHVVPKTVPAIVDRVRVERR